MLFYESNVRPRLRPIAMRWKVKEGGRARRKSGKEGKKKAGDAILCAFCDREEAPGGPPGRGDPLSYGHIRDFFSVVPAGIG